MSNVYEILVGKILVEFETYKSGVLSLSKEEIFNESFKNNAVSQIYNCICGSDIISNTVPKENVEVLLKDSNANTLLELYDAYLKIEGYNLEDYQDIASFINYYTDRLLKQRND